MMIWLLVRMLIAVGLATVALLPDMPQPWRELAIVALTAGLISLLVQQFSQQRRQQR